MANFGGFENELTPNTPDSPGPGNHQLRMAHLPSEFAPKAIVGEIFAKAQEQALLPRLGAEQIEVVYGETVIPITTTEPQAGQVGVGTSNEDREGYVKPVSGVGWSSRPFSPIKLAVIVTASEEFARGNPRGLFTSIRGKLSDSIARAMDLAVFHRRNALTGALLQGADLQGLVDTTNVVNYNVNPNPASDGNLVNQLIAAYDLIGEDYDPDRWVIDPRYRTKLAAANRGVDLNGNLLQPGDVNLGAQESSVLGLPANFHKAAPGRIGNYGGPTPPVRAFLGDFSQLKYGFADQIRFKVSDQATLTVGTGEDMEVVNLWQTNQVAVMCEVTFGWVIGDLDAFSKMVETNVAETP